ncbi:protein tyrosine phosphatase non-receptor type 18 [Cricetulus griseus]
MSRHLDLVRSFLEQLEARDLREEAILAREFSDIKARSVAWKTGGVCSTKVGSRLGNTKKNRYKDIVPYDETRVILSLLQEEGHGDYINANFIRKKCERYWAQKQEPLQIGPFCITLVSWGRDGVGGNKEGSAGIGRNPAVCASYSICLGLTTGFPAVLITFSPWWRKPIVSKELVLDPSVSTAGLGKWAFWGCGEADRRGAGCGRTGVLCAVDYVRQLLLTQTIPPNFSLFDVVLEMRKQRPAAVQTEGSFPRLSPHELTSAPTVTSLRSVASPPSPPDFLQNCAPICKDASSLRTSPALSATSRPPGGVLRDTEPRFQPSGGPPLPSFPALGTGAGKQEGSRQPGVSLLPPLLSLCSALSLPLLAARCRSISVPGPPTLPMADTYAVVQKRGAPAGTGPGTRVPSSADAPIYSQVAPRSQRPVAHTEDARGTTPPGHVPADQNPPGPDAYEEVTNGAQTGALGKSVRAQGAVLESPRSLGVRDSGCPSHTRIWGCTDGVFGEFTLSRFNFCMAPFSQASTCALEDPKGHGILQRSGQGCEGCASLLPLHAQDYTPPQIAPPMLDTLPTPNGPNPLSIVCGKTQFQGRIFGGETANPERWPWQASLLFRGNHICGAVLIDKNWIAGAAHCFQRGCWRSDWKPSKDQSRQAAGGHPALQEKGQGRTKRMRHVVCQLQGGWAIKVMVPTPHLKVLPSNRSQKPSDYRVLLGYHKLGSPTKYSRQMTVNAIIFHENFNKFYLQRNDIVLMQLHKPVTYSSHILPACVPENTTKVSLGSSCWISGWGMLTEDSEYTGAGKEEFLPSPYPLQQAQVSLMDTKKCETFFQAPETNFIKYKAIKDDMLCAEDITSGKSICRHAQAPVSHQASRSSVSEGHLLPRFDDMAPPLYHKRSELAQLLDIAVCSLPAPLRKWN